MRHGALCAPTVVCDPGRLLKAEASSPPGPPGAEEHGLYGEGDCCREHAQLSSIQSGGRPRWAPPTWSQVIRTAGGTEASSGSLQAGLMTP